MDSAQALHEFWSGFGWKAYDESTVPSADLNPEIPRITYEVMESDIGYPVTLSASLWDRSFSWETISKKTDDIYDAIGFGGVLLPYDRGAIWITRGSPFAQRLADEDDTVRRVMLNVNAEFISA